MSCINQVRPLQQASQQGHAMTARLTHGRDLDLGPSKRDVTLTVIMELLIDLQLN